MYVCTDAVKGDNQWHWACGQKAEMLVYSDLDAHLVNPRWPQSVPFTMTSVEANVYFLEVKSHHEIAATAVRFQKRGHQATFSRQ